MNICRADRSHLVLICCFLVALLAGPAQAAAAKKKPVAPPDLRKLIESVDMANSAVVIIYMETKQARSYRVDDLTALKVNGQAGKIGDVKAGMQVMDFVERDSQTLDGLTLSGFGDEPTATAKPKTKPKSKPKPASSDPAADPST